MVHYKMLQDPVQDWYDRNDLCFYYFLECMDFIPWSQTAWSQTACEAAAGCMRISNVGHVRKCLGQPRSTKRSCKCKHNIRRESETESLAGSRSRKEGRRRTLHRAR